MIKTVAFIAGKKNPAIQKFCIRFSIEIMLKKWSQMWDSIQKEVKTRICIIFANKNCWKKSTYVCRSVYQKLS